MGKLFRIYIRVIQFLPLVLSKNKPCRGAQLSKVGWDHYCESRRTWPG